MLLPQGVRVRIPPRLPIAKDTYLRGVSRIGECVPPIHIIAPWCKGSTRVSGALGSCSSRDGAAYMGGVGRVDEGACFENRRAARLREFESLTLRLTAH